MKTLSTRTFQKVEHGTIQCRKFLRKVIRDNHRSGSDGWTCRASDETDWTLEFRRTITGNIGDPDIEVTVTTDIHVTLPPDGHIGEVRSFSDADAVTVPRPRRLFLMTYSVPGLVTLLIDKNAALSIQASSGSTSSSKHGLAFFDLMVRINEYNDRVSYGGGTVTKDGVVICSGPIGF